MALGFLNDDDFEEATIGMGRGVKSLSAVLPDADTCPTQSDEDEAVGMFQEFVARLPDLEILEVQVDTAVDQHHQMIVSGSTDESQLSRFESVHRWAYCLFIFDLSYGDCQLDCLQRLRLTGPSVSPSCIDSANTCLFLQGAKDTLREVTFSNIFFADIGGPHDERIGTGMLAVIRAMGDIPGLESAFLYVPRLDSMHGSEVQDVSSQGKSARCYRSSDNDIRPMWFNLDSFEKLAGDLGVPLKGAGWDFAKHVVPQKGASEPLGTGSID